MQIKIVLSIHYASCNNSFGARLRSNFTPLIVLISFIHSKITESESSTESNPSDLTSFQYVDDYD